MIILKTQENSYDEDEDEEDKEDYQLKSIESEVVKLKLNENQVDFDDSFDEEIVIIDSNNLFKAKK